MASQTVTISVLADTKRFSSDMKSVSDSLGSLGRPLQQFGGGLKDLGGNLTNWITKPALGVAAAGAGIVSAFGWKRLVGLDTAKGQFKGLGYEGARLDRLMAGVSDGVTDTSLSMADGASIMVGALATGNLEMGDTEKHIKRVANLSAAYGLEAEHAGYLMNNVLTKNKVTWADLSQMQRNNIPIVTQLADHYGVAGDEIMKMAQDGKISVEDLNEVIDKNAGKAAEAYAETWKGVTANIIANIGKIGAELLSPTFDIMKDRAQEFLDMLRSPEWAAAATAIGQVIGEFISGVIDRIQALVTWWSSLSDGTQKAILSVAGFAVAIGPVLMAVGSLISGIGGAILWFTKMGQALGLITSALGVILSPIGLVVVAIAALVAGLVWFFTQTETGQALVETAWAAIQAAAEAVVTWFTGTAWPALQGFWTGLSEVATGVADWFNTHVVPVIVAAIDLVVAIFERMQQVFSAAWDFMAGVWDAVGGPVLALIGIVVGQLEHLWKLAWGVIRNVLETAWNVMRKIVETALGVIRGILQAVTAAIRGDWSGAWEAVKGIASTVWNGIKGVISSVLSGIWNTITTTLGTIRSRFSEVWTQIRTGVTEAFNRVRTIITERLTGVVTLVRGLPGRLRSALSNAGTALYSTGRNLIQGLLNGVGSLAKNIGKWFLDKVPGWIRTPLKKALGISSPSKEFAEYGRNLGQGLIVGISGMERKVSASTRGMARNVLRSWDDPELSVSAAGGYGHAGASARPVYQITVQALAPTPEIGRQVVAAIRDYERLTGPVLA